MITRLRGKVISINGHWVALDVNGVGYEIFCSSKCLGQINLQSEQTIIIHTDVKEDSINLYGFANIVEREVFRLLLKVKGVGAKSASMILSQIESQALLRNIGDGNIRSLQQVKGIGRKTAERIVVELRDKVIEYVNERSPLNGEGSGTYLSPKQEALEALLALGFNRNEAQSALDSIDCIETEDTGRLVQEALKHI